MLWPVHFGLVGAPTIHHNVFFPQLPLANAPAAGATAPVAGDGFDANGARAHLPGTVPHPPGAAASPSPWPVAPPLSPGAAFPAALAGALVPAFGPLLGLPGSPLANILPALWPGLLPGWGQQPAPAAPAPEAPLGAPLAPADPQLAGPAVDRLPAAAPAAPQPAGVPVDRLPAAPVPTQPAAAPAYPQPAAPAYPQPAAPAYPQPAAAPAYPQPAAPAYPHPAAPRPAARPGQPPALAAGALAGGVAPYRPGLAPPVPVYPEAARVPAQPIAPYPPGLQDRTAAQDQLDAAKQRMRTELGWAGRRLGEAALAGGLAVGATAGFFIPVLGQLSSIVGIGAGVFAGYRGVQAAYHGIKAIGAYFGVRRARRAVAAAGKNLAV